MLSLKDIFRGGGEGDIMMATFPMKIAPVLTAKGARGFPVVIIGWAFGRAS